MDHENETIPQGQGNTDIAAPQNTDPVPEAADESAASAKGEAGEAVGQVPQGNPECPRDYSYQYNSQRDSGQDTYRQSENDYTGYAQNNHSQEGSQQYNYQGSYNNTGYHTDYAQNYNEDGMDTRPLSMGEWALTILALLLPCCAGIILYIVWAFSKQGNINRRNYCRASLIIMAAIVVIYLVVFIMFGSVLFSTFVS